MSVRMEIDAPSCEAADDAVLERNSGRPDLRPLDDQPAQVDGRTSVDRNGGAAGGDRHPGEAVALYADRFRNHDRPVAGRIEHIDFALWSHCIVGVLESAAGLGKRARVSIRALRRDEDATLRLGGHGEERRYEQSGE